MARKRKSPVSVTEPDTGPRGPFPELSSLPPADPPPPPPADEEDLTEFKAEPGDNALLVKLGDCRKCQQNLAANADLILVNALKFSYSALADTINRDIPKQSMVPRGIPINAAQVIELMLRLGNLGVATPTYNTGPLAGLVWFPQTVEFFQNPNPSPPVEELWRGRASPAEIGAYFMTATAQAYNLWRRSKTNQKECCKKHVLPQNPFRKRTSIWIGSIKKKVTV